MSKKGNSYNTSFLLDRDRQDAQEVIAKLHNRDRSRYHSISDYLMAAVLAFDDGNSKINYSDAAKKDLVSEIEGVMRDVMKEGLDRQTEELNSRFIHEVITKFGE